MEAKLDLILKEFRI